MTEAPRPHTIALKIEQVPAEPQAITLQIKPSTRPSQPVQMPVDTIERVRKEIAGETAVADIVTLLNNSLNYDKLERLIALCRKANTGSQTLLTLAAALEAAQPE